MREIQSEMNLRPSGRPKFLRFDIHDMLACALSLPVFANSTLALHDEYRQKVSGHESYEKSDSLKGLSNSRIEDIDHVAVWLCVMWLWLRVFRSPCSRTAGSGYLNRNVEIMDEVDDSRCVTVMIEMTL